MVVVSYRRKNDMTKFIKVSLYTLVIIASMMTLILLLNMATTRGTGTGAIMNWASTIAEHRWWFRLLRYALYGTLLWFWPVIIHRVANRYGWSTEETQIMLHYRRRMLLWIVLVELVLIENLIGNVLKVF